MIVTQDFPPEAGGIQTYILELARHFLKRGCSVTVICPGRKGTPSPLPPEARVIRVRIHSSWLFLPLLFRLPRLLREGGFTHVFYAQWQGVLSEFLLTRRRRRHQSLCLVCGRELLTSVLFPFHGSLLRRAFRRVDAALPISHAVETLLRERGRPLGPVRLAPPGVDPARFHPMEAGYLRARYGLGEGPVIFCVARMVPRKGMDVLIQAFAAVLKKVPSAWLLLGGAGPEAPALRALAERLDVQERTRFAGRVPDGELVPHYSLASVFALPSREGPRDVEGFGIVFLEAGACGVPCVGSRTGGVADAVAEGETGLLVPQEDYKALAAALIRLLENPASAREMGEAARRRVLREFTWEAVGDKILDGMD